MKTTPDLETLLRAAPRPEPPEHLLAVLEQQIKLPSPPRSEPRPELWQLWHRFWLPVTGLAGAVVIATAILLLVSAGTTRSFADSLQMLTKVKSFHLVDRKRDGPPRPAPGGGVTPDHPDNPLVASEYWFQEDPNNPRHARMRATTPQRDVWRENNRVLEVDRKTGARSFYLDNSKFDFGGQGWWNLPGISEKAKLSEVPPAKMPGVGAAEAGAFWFGECRVPADKLVYRVWISQTNQLPVRIQLWSTAFRQVAPEALLRDWQFSDFNADFPGSVFAFETTDQDLAQLGVTRAELEALGDQAISFQLTGEAGAGIVGTLKDDAGERQVKGQLPFSIVQVQHGRLSFDFRMADGRPHEFGLRLKRMQEPLSARLTHVWGWTSTNWAGRIEGQ